VIVDSFGSPTIANDLATFDAQWGLPQANLQVMKFGNVPPYDPTNTTMIGWAEETTLDVEYAHSIAPGAKIVLAETPVAEVEGTSGLPEMMNAEKSLIDRGIGDVITQSFGATENTFPGFSSGNFSSLLNLRFAFSWHIFGGTSEASPIFSGIVALADQAAGHRLGLINPALYIMGTLSQAGGSNGIVDVTSGNNSFGGVTGFTAKRGYDLASGWGTIDAAKFVPTLARFG
jgi:subtilase family serine protease